MKTRLILVSFLPLLAVGGAASAQETNEVSLVAVYLGAPTDWCRADDGVPLAITMNGPDIVATPEGWPVTVRERRGTQSSGVVLSAKGTASLQRRLGLTDAQVIGRFSADFQACQNPWNTSRVTGTWHLTAADGAELDSGRLDEQTVDLFSLPFFQRASRYSDALYATFDERQLFTADYPKITTSQTFAAETDKELAHD